MKGFDFLPLSLELFLRNSSIARFNLHCFLSILLFGRKETFYFLLFRFSKEIECMSHFERLVQKEQLSLWSCFVKPNRVYKIKYIICDTGLQKEEGRGWSSLSILHLAILIHDSLILAVDTIATTHFYPFNANIYQNTTFSQGEG